MPSISDTKGKTALRKMEASRAQRRVAKVLNPRRPPEKNESIKRLWKLPAKKKEEVNTKLEEHQMSIKNQGGSIDRLLQT